MSEKEFLDALYEGLKESYPDCQDMIKEQFDLIKSGKKPTNVIGMFIDEDVTRFLKRKNTRVIL